MKAIQVLQNLKTINNMYAKQANEIVLKYLTPTFIENAYTYKKNKWGGFVKKISGGHDHVYLTNYNYFPLQIPAYSIRKRFDIVEEIYDELALKFNLNRTVSEINETFCFSYESLNALHTSSYLSGGETATKILDNADQIKKFLLEIGFPMLDKYSTLNAIDAEINGNDFWHTDWMHKFALGGAFHFKRLIIAKLCNNPKFDELCEFHLTEHEEIKKKYLNNVPMLVDGKNVYQYLIDGLLKEAKII